MSENGRTPNGQFVPGVSANPGGRSTELARRQTHARMKAAGFAPEVIDYYAKVLRDEREPTLTRLKAGCELLNRGLGLPVASIDIDVLIRRKLTELSTDELRELSQRMEQHVLPPVIEHVVDSGSPVDVTDDPQDD
jgi:hypothetical protein